MRYQEIAIIILITLMAGVACAEQTNSLYLRQEEEIQKNALRGKMEGVSSQGSGTRKDNTKGPNTFQAKSIRKASWTSVEESQPKGFHVHDLITIQILESSKSSTQAKTKTERETEVDFAIKDWIRLTDMNLRPDKQTRGDPRIAGSFTRDFDSKGDISRADTLSAKIQEEVIDVLPNGTLSLEATHTVLTDDETTVITLTGKCRSKDIGIDNSIISSKIARCVVKKEHFGTARNATKQGWAMKLLDILNPF
ncbi:MAG: flagellar basal body L-ring protein FlgH [Phycisphaerae bacterium]|nr:flagellar basal body L-ring protein FlgH [Phycisphaerae bacterium]